MAQVAPGHSAPLRVAAVIEWAKGAFVAVAAFGLLNLAGSKTQGVLLAALDRFHFAGRAAAESSWLHLLASDGAMRRTVALVALAYVLLRLIEGTGLWFGRAWARWLGIVTCVAYLMIESWLIVKDPGLPGVLAIASTLMLLGLLWPRRVLPSFQGLRDHA